MAVVDEDDDEDVDDDEDEDEADRECDELEGEGDETGSFRSSITFCNWASWASAARSFSFLLAFFLALRALRACLSAVWLAVWVGEGTTAGNPRLSSFIGVLSDVIGEINGTASSYRGGKGFGEYDDMEMRSGVVFLS